MRLKNIFISSFVMAGLAIGLHAQAPAQKNWKDRAEYDLYTEITKPDATPQARLQNLEKWKAGYAQSEYADVRLKIYLVTYQQMNNHRAAVDTAVEILKAEPNDLAALTEIVGFGLSLVPADPKATLSAANKADLETVEKTAAYVTGNLDAIYAADKKPPQGMTDDQWAAAKPAMAKFAQFTMARAYVIAKDTEKAEAALTKTLEGDATNTQAAYMLAGLLLGQQKDHPEKMPKAIFFYARAASYDGQGALPAATRTQVDGFLAKAYATYHGSAQGLNDVKTAAKASALPPADFSIKSTVDIAKEQEEKRQAALKDNPVVGFWNDIKENLTGDGSAMYWEALKDSAVPGGVNGVMKFKGKLVSATPETNPKELMVAVAGEAGDAKIVIEEGLKGKMDPGGEISFSGTAKEFSKDPYVLTFDSEATDIEGWTGKAPAGRGGAAKKGAPAAAPATKKKQ
ncbi:MAG: hypothetical protein ABL967_02775 [Bryobacteraceae bacterium]